MAVDWQIVLLGVAAGAAVSVLTTPVGISGAVFLLPVQLDLLHVPSPQVTPTNLLFNVVAVPGSLLRYRRQGQLGGPLTRQMILGTLPGVAIGAIIRVELVPDTGTFRLFAAAVLAPIGVYLLARTRLRRTTATPQPRTPAASTIVGLAFVVGVVGGIYGIGGGSLLGPILVGLGLPLALIAPAALASTFITSIAGALTYAVLGLTHEGDIAPNWILGLSCGLGGLVGGYLGARLQPRVPETALRILLALLAIAIATLYVAQSISM